MTRFFVFPMLFLQFGASAAYFFIGDWRRGVYWISAFSLTWIVTTL